jgi:hypothetical protein
VSGLLSAARKCQFYTNTDFHANTDFYTNTDFYKILTSICRLLHFAPHHQVEESLKSGHDLNAFVLETNAIVNTFAQFGNRDNSADVGDNFTLLHLAVWNDHLDAIQRLLNTGLVQVSANMSVEFIGSDCRAARKQILDTRYRYRALDTHRVV